jgi:hypothetical protein
MRLASCSAGRITASRSPLVQALSIAAPPTKLLDLPRESCKVPILRRVTHDARVRIESALEFE